MLANALQVAAPPARPGQGVCPWQDAVLPPARTVPLVHAHPAGHQAQTPSVGQAPGPAEDQQACRDLRASRLVACALSLMRPDRRRQAALTLIRQAAGRALRRACACARTASCAEHCARPARGCSGGGSHLQHLAQGLDALGQHRAVVLDERQHAHHGCVASQGGQASQGDHVFVPPGEGCRRAQLACKARAVAAGLSRAQERPTSGLRGCRRWSCGGPGWCPGLCPRRLARPGLQRGSGGRHL